MSFVSHVECTICGHRHDAKRVLSVCEQCGQMLAVRYDLEQVNKHVTKEALRARPPGMYRFRELTPLDEDETPVTLGEGSTPLLALRRLAAHFGLRHVWGKDEGQNPTGSFKARGLGMAITLARARGATGFVIPSAGNAGGAAAVYAARCGLPCAVIVPRGTPPAAIAEAAIAGAKVFTIEGSIATAGGSGGGSYLMPAPVSTSTTRASAEMSRRSLSTPRAATSAAPSGDVHTPSRRPSSRCASWMARSLTATASPPVSRRIFSICRPAKGEGTRSPAACVVGFSHAAVVSAPSWKALTTGAQPSACTAITRGSGSPTQPIARSSS